MNHSKAMFVFWAIYYSIELTFCTDPEKVSLILGQSQRNPPNSEHSVAAPLHEQTDNTVQN